MAKSKTQYSCTNCGYVTVKWVGCCPGCSEWNSVVAKENTPSSSKTTSAQPAQLYELSAISTEEAPRLVSGIREWDRVLGGGILPGSFLILTGDPGIGKSTLLLQIAHHIARKHTVFYFSSEESLQQVKSRALRLGCDGGSLLFSDQSSLESVISSGKEHKPDVLILDSIQNCHFAQADTIPGTAGQLREAAFHLMRLAKEHNIAVLVTGHITKEGHMAGPKLLEHMVDGVFYLQGEERFHTRILRSVKNRFGTINELGFFEMQQDGMQEVGDINKLLLSDWSNAPGSALISLLEGTKPLILDVQALCIPSKLSVPQRVITGMDHKRVVLIAAILEKYLKIKFSSHDIFFKVSGSFKLKDSSSDLGIALALLSSYFQQSLPEQSLAIGELSLTGHVKPTYHAQRCIQEAERFGITQIFTSRNQSIKSSHKTIKGFRTVYDLLSLFPDDEIEIGTTTSPSQNIAP